MNKIFFRNFFYATLTVLFLSGLVLPFKTCADGLVDPALVGTWQLPNQAVYWEIRADGTYQLTNAGKVIHSGNFSAAYGTWSLSSDTWGEDGGEYQLPAPDTFVGTGKLGPATWKRVAQRASQSAPAGGIVLSTQRDGTQLLPQDIPELVQTATQRARDWQPDAVPVSVDFKQIDAPNMKGPEVRIFFLSPFQNTGLLVTVNQKGAHTNEFNQAVAWGRVSLPVVFVDLPTALNIARKNGMKGQLKKAGLQIWSPDGAPPVLAWMLHTGTAAGGKTVNAATGEIIDFDVTGYIDSYNAQWEQAAKGLRALIRSAQPHSSGFAPTGDGSAGSDQPGDNGEAAQAEYERNAAEGRAYWGGSSEDYNRIKNGECTWSDSSNYGC